VRGWACEGEEREKNGEGAKTKERGGQRKEEKEEGEAGLYPVTFPESLDDWGWQVSELSVPCRSFRETLEGLKDL
jgi:hypothetical protein